MNQSTIKNQINFLRKIFLNLNSYLASLIDMGYGSGTDKATVSVLVIASLLLSFASAYTTFIGLKSFTFWPVALLMTIGIQGLLFGVSWKLGKLLIINEINFGVIAIWLITLSISSYFSYSALLEDVYSKDEQASNRNLDLIKLGNETVTKINSQLEQQLRSIPFDEKKYSIWKTNIITIVNDDINKKSNQLKILKEKYNEFQDRKQKEIDKGGTEYYKNGKKLISTAGTGDISDSFLAQANSIQKNEIEPLQEALNTQKEFLKKTLKDIQDYEASKDSTKLNALMQYCDRITSSSDAGVLRCTDNLLSKDLNNQRDSQESYASFKKECINALNSTKSFESNFQIISSCINLANISSDDKIKYSNNILTYQKYTSSNTKFFVIAYNELLKLNPLAYICLILALAIDTLILLCSLIASKHNKFLTMTDRKDLLQMEDYPLDIVLGVTLDVNESDSPTVKRIKQILSIGYFDIDYAKDSYSMLIKKSDLDKQNMHKELGTFLTMGLARPFENGDVIGIKTNCVLWMCEYISKKAQSTTTHNEFRNTFKDIGDIDGSQQ